MNGGGCWVIGQHCPSLITRRDHSAVSCVQMRYASTWPRADLCRTNVHFCAVPCKLIPTCSSKTNLTKHALCARVVFCERALKTGDASRDLGFVRSGQQLACHVVSCSPFVVQTLWVRRVLMWPLQAAAAVVCLANVQKKREVVKAIVCCLNVHACAVGCLILFLTARHMTRTPDNEKC